MPTLRKCAKCGEPAMEPVARKMDFYNSVYHYKCSKCEHEVELVPLASIGVQITIGLLVAIVVWFIFFTKNSSHDLLNLILFFAVMSIVPGMALYQLWKHYSYGVVDYSKTRTHMDVDETKNITKSPVVWVEKFGFLGGLLAPIALIVVVLGTAAVIGFINFTYFDDDLFTMRFWQNLF